MRLQFVVQNAIIMGSITGSLMLAFYDITHGKLTVGDFVVFQMYI